MFSPLKRFVFQREKGGGMLKSKQSRLPRLARSQTLGLSYSCEFGLIPIFCTKSHSVGRVGVG